MVCVASDSSFIARRVNSVPLCPHRLHPLVSRFYNKNTFIQCFNSEPASQSVTQSGSPVQVRVAENGRRIKRFWASVANSDTTLSQQRDESMCVLGTLNAITVRSLKSKIPDQNGCQKTHTRNSNESVIIKITKQKSKWPPQKLIKPSPNIIVT